MTRQSKVAGQRRARHSLRALLAGGVLLAAAASPAVGQCQYEVSAIILGPPYSTSGHAPLIGRGMNNNAEVVGYWQGCFGPTYRAFYWSEKTGLITLPTPPGVSNTRANDINDDGLICGDHLFPSIGWRAFVYDITSHPGEYTYLEPLQDVGSSWGNAINNNGVVAGARSIGKRGTNPYNAVIWDTASGEATDLGVMNGPNSTAVDINEDGNAVGWSGSSVISSNVRAIYWFSGRGVDLGLRQSYLQQMNDNGEMIGIVDGIQFLWVDGRMSFFPPPPGYDLVSNVGMSDTGRTGRLRITGTNAYDPFVWHGDEYHVLDEFIRDSPSGLVVSHGSILANEGMILARGHFNGDSVAIGLKPIDQPIGDLTGDCKVCVWDLEVLLEQWTVKSQSATSTFGDLNDDGVVNVLDLLILLSNWG